MAKDYWGRISKENDKSFEDALDELYMAHHHHQSNTPHFETSKSEDARTAELDAQAAQLARQGTGKTWVNGLPGPVSSESFVSDSTMSQSWSSGCARFVVAVFVVTMIIMVVLAIKANNGGL